MTVPGRVIIDVAQRTEAWQAARVGRLTGSRAAAILATLKSGGEPAARRDLRLQLACERLTGRPADERFVTRDMQRGIDREADALAAYEAHSGVIVQPVGFVAHSDLLAGCSPDGFVGSDGLVEVKCPKSTTHLATLLARTIPAEHLAQIIHNIWITDRRWCDFVSFDDRFPIALQLLVMRFDRDDAALRAYKLLARQFLRDVDTEQSTVAALDAQLAPDEAADMVF